MMIRKAFLLGMFGLAGSFICSVAAAATIVVTSTADGLTGCSLYGVGAACTLRDAITYSNWNPQPPGISNQILFNIPGSGVQAIALNDPLPAITTQAVIDGYSQPGASPNTLAVGDSAMLLIELTGYALDCSTFDPFLTVNGGSGSLIKGLVFVSTRQVCEGEGMRVPSIILSSCCNQIKGNFIGILPDGLSYGSDSAGAVYVASSGNDIGGSSAEDRNIFGHGWGIDTYPWVGFPLLWISGWGNNVRGNYFGTNRDGKCLPNGSYQVPCGDSQVDILITGDDNFIGGAGAGEGNVISGARAWFDGEPKGHGVRILGDYAFANIIAGNLIGTDASGTTMVSNDVGISVEDASDNFLGGLTQGNRIAFNYSSGIEIRNSSGFSSRNSICCNSIYGNGYGWKGGLGIDLAGDGVTQNDPGDWDAGPNDFQNFPLLTFAVSGVFTTQVFGSLNSLPNALYRLQFFSNTSCDPSGFGEGENFLGETLAMTNANGDLTFNVSLPGGSRSLRGQFITATATDNGGSGSTSEFSACKQVE